MNVKNFRKIFSLVIVVIFIIDSMPFIPLVNAQSPMIVSQGIVNLPPVGTGIALSPSRQPAIVQGMTLYPDNPFKFDFIIDEGEAALSGDEFEKEAKKLISYFMASLTVPEDEMWVNLSPYEENRIIADALGKTELGKDLLSEDYILKQITSSLMSPENKVGAEFWDQVYQKVYEEFGVTQIPMNSFNKVWIVPEKASVYISGNSVFVVERHLKVMLEEDYWAQKKEKTDNAKKQDDTVGADQAQTAQNNLARSIIREIIIPAITKEVNEGKNFAILRQIFNSMILAAWYKKNLKESFLGKLYVDQNKINGIDLKDKDVKEKIYRQYLESFKKGVYDFIKEEYDPVSQTIVPRKYFSGGVRGVDDVSTLDSSMISRSQKSKFAKLLKGIKHKVSFEIRGSRQDKQGSESPVRLRKKLSVRRNANMATFAAAVVLSLFFLNPALASDFDKDIQSQIQSVSQEGTDLNKRLADLSEDLRKAQKVISLYEEHPRDQKSWENTVKLQDHIAEIGQILRVPTSDTMRMTGTLRVGVFGDRLYNREPLWPMSTMYPSPYASLDLIFDYDGMFTFQTGITGSFSQIRSRQYTEGINGTLYEFLNYLSSPERKQNLFVSNVYTDIGKTFQLGEDIAHSFFAGINLWNISGLSGEYSQEGKLMGSAEGNLGWAGIYQTSWESRWKGYFDLNFAFEADNYYLEDSLRPFLETATAGGEYSRRLNESSFFSIGLKGTWKAFAREIAMSVNYNQGPFSLRNTLMFQKSSTASIPDVFGMNSKILFQITDAVKAGITIGFERGENRPFDSTNQEVKGGILFEWTPIVRKSIKQRIKVEQSFALDKKTDELYRGPNTLPVTFPFNTQLIIFDYLSSQEKQKELEDEYLGITPQYPLTDFLYKSVAKYKSLFSTAKTYEELINEAQVNTVEDVLSLVSIINLFGKRHNYELGKNAIDSPNMIYENIREGIFLNQGAAQAADITEIPTYDCTGAATFAARLTSDLLRKIDKKAFVMPTNVLNYDDGNFMGHAVTLVATENYGICIVDWGTVIPTYSYDFENVMRIYQAMEGIPAFYNEVRKGSKGKYAGRFFTNEGKVMLEALTLMGENEQGYQRTLNRFMEKTEAQLEGRSFLEINYPDGIPSLDLVKARWEADVIKKQIKDIKASLSKGPNALTDAVQALEADEAGDVGGIDLNPGNMRLDVSGDRFQYILFDDFKEAPEMNVNRFMPWIISITPMQNLSSLLGLN